MTIFDFANQIDQVYRGLGNPTLYSTLSILANKSVFFIGESGTGKTRTIRLTPKIEGTYVSKWDTITYEELSDYCGSLTNYRKEIIRNKHLVFKIEEFATFSDYHRELFLTVGSRIISDGRFVHTTSRSPFLNIQDCKLTMLVAIQPLLYNRLCLKYTEWEALSHDRFTKFLVLNPLRQERTVNIPLVATLPRKISTQATLNENEVDLNILVNLFKKQVSDGRATLYARDYARAMARFMGAESVEQKHVNLFHQLFYPYLNSFKVLQKADDLNSPRKVTTANLRLLGEIAKYTDYVSKSKLADDLEVDKRNIERPAKELLEVGLIEKPSPKAGRYRISEPLRKYFDEYDGRIP